MRTNVDKKNTTESDLRKLVRDVFVDELVLWCEPSHGSTFGIPDVLFPLDWRYVDGFPKVGGIDKPRCVWCELKVGSVSFDDRGNAHELRYKVRGAQKRIAKDLSLLGNDVVFMILVNDCGPLHGMLFLVDGASPAAREGIVRLQKTEKPRSINNGNGQSTKAEKTIILAQVPGSSNHEKIREHLLIGFSLKFELNSEPYTVD